MTRKISRQEILQKFENGEIFYYLEATSLKEYEQLHIRGALHLPLESIDKLAKKTFENPASEIVIYGQNERDVRAMDVANRLSDLGFINLFHYAGGKEDWLNSGGPFEKSQQVTILLGSEKYSLAA